MLVVLGDPHRDLRDLVLLVAVDHTQIPRRRPDPAPQSQRPVGNRSRRSCGSSVHARCDPGAPGCLPRARAGPDPDAAASPAPGACPGRHHARAGSRSCPSYATADAPTGPASRPAPRWPPSAPRAARPSPRSADPAPRAAACSASCPAWRPTTTSNSSRDISSGPGTGRSNRTPADQSLNDTPATSAIPASLMINLWVNVYAEGCKPPTPGSLENMWGASLEGRAGQLPAC